jgi:hypothetical protein
MSDNGETLQKIKELNQLLKKGQKTIDINYTNFYDNSDILKKIKEFNQWLIKEPIINTNASDDSTRFK